MDERASRTSFVQRNCIRARDSCSSIKIVVQGAHLSDSREKGDADPSRWTLASASDDDARALAGVLGIRYRKLESGEFFHSSVIVLLDGEGRPVVRLDGLGKDATPILGALEASSS